MIDAGRRSKWRSMSAWISVVDSAPVPNESTDRLIGRAMPMP